MAIRLFFEYERLVVQMPVNPPNLSVKTKGNNQTTNIVSLGEINLLNDTNLQEISFSGFLPVNVTAPYVITTGKFEKPQFYIDFFNKIRKAKKPCNFVVSDTNINLLVSIEDFDYDYSYGSEDIKYSIKLKEYKNYSIKTVAIVNSTAKTNEANTASSTANKTTNTTKTTTTKEITIGCKVIVNGRLHRDSYGNGPGLTEKNATRKISHIVKNRKCPYHVTNLQGGYRGWVSESSVKRV